MVSRWKFGRSVLVPLVLAVAGLYLFVANFNWFLFQIADVEFFDAQAKVTAKTQAIGGHRGGSGALYYVDVASLEAVPRYGRAVVNSQFYASVKVGDTMLVLTRGKTLYLADDVRWQRTPYFWIYLGAGILGLAGAVLALVGFIRWRRA